MSNTAKVQMSLSEIQRTLSIGWNHLLNMVETLMLDPQRQKNGRKILGPVDISRLTLLKKVEDRGCATLEETRKMLALSERELADLVQRHPIQMVKDVKTGDRLLDHRDFLLLAKSLQQTANKEKRPMGDTKTNENSYDFMQNLDLNDSLTSEEAAKQLGFSVEMLEKYHEDGELLVGKRIKKNFPLLWTKECLEKMKAHLFEEEEKRKAEIAKKTKPLPTELAPQLSKLGTTVASLETTVQEEMQSLREEILEMREELGYRQEWESQLEQRLIEHTETLTMILGWVTDPQNLINRVQDVQDKTTEVTITSRDSSLSNGEAWGSNLSEDDEGEIKLSSVSRYTIKEALEHYRKLVLSRDPEIRINDRNCHKLEEFSKQVRNRLRKHFSKDDRGLSMTDFHQISLKGQGFNAKNRKLVQYAALGLIAENDDLSIVQGNWKGGRRARFLYMKEDYLKMELDRKQKGIPMPHGEEMDEMISELVET